MDSPLNRDGRSGDRLGRAPAREGDRAEQPETSRRLEPDAPARWIRNSAEENIGPSVVSPGGETAKTECVQEPSIAPVVLDPDVRDPDILDPDVLDPDMSVSPAGEATEGPGVAPVIAPVILEPVILDPDILDPVVSVFLDGDTLDVKILDLAIPEPPQSASSSSGILARFAVATRVFAVGVIAALLLVRMLPAGGIEGTGGHAPPANLAAPHLIGQKQSRTQGRTTEEPPNVPRARLVTLRAPVGNLDEAIPLGLSLTETGQDAALLLKGFPAGTTISPGIALGTDNWLLSASELSNAVIRPPRGFVGAIDLAVELRLANETVADRSSLRVAWLETPKRTTAVAVPVDAGSTGAQRREMSNAQLPSAPLRRLDREEITDLIRRGEELMTAGNLAPARLVFRRAAEAGDPEAAFRLAMTYDPMLLETRGVVGVVADMAIARAWYEKAREFGSASASLRLQVLASPDR